jgi:hypothetical protein
MSEAAALVAQLAAAGTPPELLAAVAEQLFAGQASIAELAAHQRSLDEKRTKDRERQQRHRLSRDVTVTSGDEALPDVTPSPDKSAPQTPLQNNPIPSPPFKSPSSQKRGTRLADNFEPPEDWIVWAEQKRGWGREEAIDECECFIRYWQAKPGRDACKLDWPKTWQNWVVNSRRPERETAAHAWDGMA